MALSTLTFPWDRLIIGYKRITFNGGETVSTEIEKARSHVQDAVGLVKNGKNIIANDYEYALAA